MDYITMKFFIAISGLTLLFKFSISKLFILRYKNSINHWKLDEDKWENFVFENNNIEHKQTLCKELEDSPIFTDESSVNDKYYSTKCERIKTELVVKQTSVLIGFNKKIITTLRCKYDGSTVYLAKHSNCEHILLFEQRESYIPSLTGVAVKPIELKYYPKNVSKQFHVLLKQYDSLKGFNAWRNVNFVFQEEVKILQLCMTFFFHTIDNSTAETKIQLKVSGHYSNQRIMDVIRVLERDDAKVDKTISLDPVDYENEDENENEIMDYVVRRKCETKTYKVPTIKCDALTVAPYIRHESRTTLFFMPHPNSNNNGVLFYYKYYNKDNIYLYREKSYVYYAEPNL